MILLNFAIFSAIGAMAGWQAGSIMKSGGIGVAGNIFIGIIGGLIGGYLYMLLAIAAGGLIGSIATAALGALILLFVVDRVKNI